MDLKFKNKVLTVALISSLWIHIAGFLVLKVKALDAAPFVQFLEVGLLESRWDEPFVNLPGELEGDEEIFGPSDHMFLKKYSNGKLKMRNQANALELPQSRLSGALSVNIDSTQKEEVAQSSHSEKNGLRLNQIKPKIEGPVSKRNVLFQKNPVYPVWAQRYGLEFEIRLKFWVLPSGEVSLVVIQDSSGYPEIDAKVARSMKRWRFDSLEDEDAQTQWGTVLFKFRLKR